MEGSRLPNRLIFGPLIICIFIAQSCFFIPLYLKECAKVEKEMEINEKKHKKEQQELIIRKYQQYLKLEKSLSLNTLDAYLTDLDKLMSFLKLEGIYVLDVCLSDLQRFAAGLHDIGIHPRSQARILSGIKSFFRFLILENYLEADPSELLEGPKIGFKLPEVLTVEEIDRIISPSTAAKLKDSETELFRNTIQLRTSGIRTYHP